MSIVLKLMNYYGCSRRRRHIYKSRHSKCFRSIPYSTPRLTLAVRILPYDCSIPAHSLDNESQSVTLRLT